MVIGFKLGVPERTIVLAVEYVLCEFRVVRLIGFKPILKPRDHIAVSEEGLELRDKRGIIERASRLADGIVPVFPAFRTFIEFCVSAKKTDTGVDAAVVCADLEPRENTKAPPSDEFAR